MHTTFHCLTRFDRLFKLLITFSFALVATNAIASSDDLMIRDNDEHGNFKIDYTQFCSDKCDLQESTDFGATWYKLERYYAGNPHSSFVVTDKPDGTYKYRIKDFEYDWEEQETIVEYSEVVEVIVGPVSPPPTLEEQLDYAYDTRVGDINSDGLQDIFLDRTTAAPANNGTIKSILLKQVSGGKFETIVPNTSQINAASSWPLSAIDVLLADVNLDGFADVRLDGVGNEIPGVYDQLVYSPAVAYTDVARNVRAIDPSFESFANDMTSHYLDDNYFTDRRTQVYEQGDWDVEYDCDLEWRGILGWEWICTVEYVWEPGGWVTDYTGVTDAAADIWESALSAEAGLGSWSVVVDALARQMGVDIQIGNWCISVGGSASSNCDNAGATFSILQLFLLLKKSESPKGRALDTVYLTSRKVLYFGPRHTALEYSRLVGGVRLKSITSAAPSVPLTTAGYLNNKLNRWQDFANTTVTTVSSVNYPLAIYHWDAMFEGHLRWKDGCVPYEGTRPWFGEPPFPQGEFNSNSYVAGLIELTNSVLASGAMHDFWGGENPVPNEYYTLASPCP